MIVLNVTYKCSPDRGRRFLEAIWTEKLDEACRAEEGNIKYDYYYPADDGDELLLVEKWQDATALKAHGETPHFAQLGTIKPEYVTETVVERFER